MPAPTGKDYVTRGHPKVGRARLDDGSFVSIADVQFTRSLLDEGSVVLRKQGYFFQDLRLNVPQDNEYYYRLKAPADKHLVIFSRSLSAGEGPVRFDTVVQPTSYTPGAPLTPTNLYTGGPASAAELEAGVVPSGGVTIPADYLFGAGNKVGTAGSSDLPTVLPPSTEIFAMVTNISDGPNPGIRFALAFAELVIPDILVIS